MIGFRALLKTGFFILATHSLTVHAQPNTNANSDQFGEPDESQFICDDDKCVNDLRLLHRLSRFGSMDSHTILGVAYATGDGLEQDIKHGVGRLKIAIRHGHAPAMLVMSDWYRDGTYVDADPQQSQKYLDMAIDAGYPPALYRSALTKLQNGDPQQVSEAVTLLEEASERQLVSAMYLLARLKYVGGLVEYDLIGAADLFRRLSLAGHEEAPTYLREIIAELKATEREEALATLRAEEQDAEPLNVELYIANLESALDIERIQVYGQTFNFEIESPLTHIARRLDYSARYQRGSMMRIRTATCSDSMGCVVVQPRSGQRSLNEALTGRPE